MKRRHLLCAAALLISPLASHAAKFNLTDFHDMPMLEGAGLVAVKPGFAAGISGGAIDATARLSKTGMLGMQYDTTRSSGPDAYRVVKVSSGEAPNLRWEVWARTDSSLFGARTYQKIMGPFKVDEEAKLMFVNNGIGQSHERNVLFVVYSPTETERSVRLDMSEVRP
jgi:hypothetical protein